MAIIQPMQAVYVEWALMSLAVPIIAARLYFQRTRKGRLFWADWFIILAWWFFAFQTAADWTMRYFYTPKEILVQDGDNTTLGALRSGKTFSQTILIAKLKYSENVTYYSCLYFVKFAWLCFFQTLIPKVLRTLRIIYWIVVVITIIGYIFTTLINTFYCWPIRRRWSLDGNFCFNPEWVWIVIMTVHTATDLIIYLLPILVLRRLHNLSRKSRLGVGLLFSLGFICVAWAVILQVENLTFVTGAVVCITAAFEQFWAIFVVCLPPLKTLLSSEVRSIKSNWANRRESHGKLTPWKRNDNISDPESTVAGASEYKGPIFTERSDKNDDDRDDGRSSREQVVQTPDKVHANISLKNL